MTSNYGNAKLYIGIPTSHYGNAKLRIIIPTNKNANVKFNIAIMTGNSVSTESGIIKNKIFFKDFKSGISGNYVNDQFSKIG